VIQQVGFCPLGSMKLPAQCGSRDLLADMALLLSAGKAGADAVPGPGSSSADGM